MSNSKIISCLFLLFLIFGGTNDPHRVLMALNMAEDKDVLVYFDIKGVEIVLKDAIDLEFSHFPSSLTQLKNLMEKECISMSVQDV